MPTTYTDQFYVMDPGNPPAAGTALNWASFDYIDNDDDGFIRPNMGDTFNGVEVTSVWYNDVITVNVPGVGNVTITGVTFYLAGQPAVFTPTDGTVLENATFVSSTWVYTSTEIVLTDFGPVCFALGTKIETVAGALCIETLRAGDQVLTRDHGAQPILWIGRQTIEATGDFAPIRFLKGAIGNSDVLEVSPEHRILVTGWQAELLFGVDEVLVAAKHLVNGDTIFAHKSPSVDYFHLLFEDHEIIISEGVASESYLPGHALNRRESAVQAEILGLFPDIEGQCARDTTRYWTPARPVLKQHEALLLAA